MAINYEIAINGEMAINYGAVINCEKAIEYGIAIDYGMVVGYGMVMQPEPFYPAPKRGSVGPLGSVGWHRTSLHGLRIKTLA